MIDEIVPQDYEEALWLSDLIRSKVNNNDDEKQPHEASQGKGVEHDDIIF